MTENTLTAQQAFDLAKSHYDSGAYDQAAVLLRDLARAAPHEPRFYPGFSCAFRKRPE